MLAACAFFLFWGLKGPAGFILELRATKLAALLLVGAATGISTVLFQTVTGNRILTPAILGFDSLFLLVQSLLVLGLGGLGYAMADGAGKFLLDTALMMAASLALFSLLTGRGRGDLHRMILVGVIFGLFFRSMTAFVLRLIDPSEYSVIQSAMFASFGSIEAGHLAMAAALFVPVMAVIWRLAPAMDVIGLGRDSAVGLGLRYDRLCTLALLLVAALVAVSTALVGPVSFLGLLVSALAHELMKTPRHALLLPAAALIAGLILVIGQGVFERILGLQSTLSVIIEFAGGLLFLYLVLGGRR
nr:iron chelate uptake ABC transporter family permease subunit [Mangrovicoccus algicola]